MYLELGAFDLDRRLDVGPRRAEFAIDDAALAYSLAATGDRPLSLRNGRRELLVVVHRLINSCGTGLLHGPECSVETLNGYSGARCGRHSPTSLSSQHMQADEFAVSSLLESVSKHGVENIEPVSDSTGTAALAAVRPNLKTKLHAYQERGVAWMVGREAAEPVRTLHPAWLQVGSTSRQKKGFSTFQTVFCVQLVGADNQVFYLHSYTAEASTRYFAAPCSDTCGGMLCDEVGLGKSVQVKIGHCCSRCLPVPFPSFIVRLTFPISSFLPLTVPVLVPIPGLVLVTVPAPPAPAPAPAPTAVPIPIPIRVPV